MIEEQDFNQIKFISKLWLYPRHVLKFKQNGWMLNVHAHFQDATCSILHKKVPREEVELFDQPFYAHVSIMCMRSRSPYDTFSMPLAFCFMLVWFLIWFLFIIQFHFLTLLIKRKQKYNVQCHPYLPEYQ